MKQNLVKAIALSATLTSLVACNDPKPDKEVEKEKKENEKKEEVSKKTENKEKESEEQIKVEEPKEEETYSPNSNMNYTVYGPGDIEEEEVEEEPSV